MGENDEKRPEEKEIKLLEGEKPYLYKPMHSRNINYL